MNYKHELKEMLPKSSKDFINFGRSLKAKYPKLMRKLNLRQGSYPIVNLSNVFIVCLMISPLRLYVESHVKNYHS